MCDRVWCICAIDADTGEEYAFASHGSEMFHEWIKVLGPIELLIGHDIQAFDLPVLEKLYGFKFGGEVFDTKLAARCIYPDTKRDDWRSKLTGEPWHEVPGKLSGSHTLKAWGIRLGVHKGDRTAQDFSRYSKEMLEYCIQDCRVTLALYKHLVAQNPSEAMLRLEHRFSQIIDQQKLNGFCFDIRGAEALTRVLQTERLRLEDELKDLFPPRVEVYYTPVKRLERTKTIIFNPASRDHITYNLIKKYGWKPKEFGDNGKPTLDADVLATLPYPEIKQLVNYFLIQDRLGSISEGKQAWLKLVHTDGKIHGGVNTNGTPHGRCSHIGPNMAQVPNMDSAYGTECRKLFTADPGWALVGADASGIQLRALAHYLYPYDGGEYANLVCTGDPHERHRQALGVNTRSEAKTFIYAFLFGSGSTRIGEILGVTQQVGASLIRRFLHEIPAIARLRAAINRTLDQRGYLVGLDGRHIPIRGKHVGLNYLLTAFEAVIMKQTVVDYQRRLEDLYGYRDGHSYKQVGMVHDEIQVTCEANLAELIGGEIVKTIEDTGVLWGSKCPLTGKYHIGRNWSETH